MVERGRADDQGHLILNLAGQRVDLNCQHADVRRTLQAAWAPALMPALRSQIEGQEPQARIEIDDKGALFVDGSLRREDPFVEDRACQVEKFIITELLPRRSEALQLHAGCVRWGKHRLLLVGESGSGKSTFTRLLIRAGAEHLTDDWVLIEGERVLGVARTVQFDSLGPDDAVPPYFRDCDVDTYRVLSGKDELRRKPLWTGPHNTIDSLPLSGAPWTVVELRRDPKVTQIARCSDLERLAAIQSATISAGADYRGELGWGPSYRLSWHEPEQALRLLERELELNQRSGAP